MFRGVGYNYIRVYYEAYLVGYPYYPHAYARPTAATEKVMTTEDRRRLRTVLATIPATGVLAGFLETSRSAGFSGENNHLHRIRGIHLGEADHFE